MEYAIGSELKLWYLHSTTFSFSSICRLYAFSTNSTIQHSQLSTISFGFNLKNRFDFIQFVCEQCYGNNTKIGNFSNNTEPRMLPFYSLKHSSCALTQCELKRWLISNCESQYNKTFSYLHPTFIRYPCMCVYVCICICM